MVTLRIRPDMESELYAVPELADLTSGRDLNDHLNSDRSGWTESRQQSLMSSASAVVSSRSISKALSTRCLFKDVLDESLSC